MSPIVSLATERVRRQLQTSVDLADFGESICDVGSAINSAGRHLMMLHQLPTPHMLDDVEFMAMNVIKMVGAIRVAASVVPELPSDCERAE